MPKYIDLLRSHHSPRDPSAESENEKNERLPAEKNTDALPRSNEKRHQLMEETVAYASSNEENSDEEDKKWLDQCVGYVLSQFMAAAKHKHDKIDTLSEHVASLLDLLAKQPNRLANLELAVSSETMKIGEADDELGNLVEKSVTMMLYAIKMGIQLQFNDDELRGLVLAGMLHHIGMAQIPAEIRHKKSKLSAKERDLIRHVPEQGAEYLRQCGVRDERILTAASQAQERVDGSGPMGLKEKEISRTARVIGLLSMFEALIHYRAYRKRLLPRDAIRELLIRHKSAFDPAFLKCLIDAISLYPVGTYVQLNSGDIGQVIRVHHRLPLRPTVHVSMDRYGNGIVTRDVNMQTQPALIVERCMYREDVLEISQQGQHTQAG